MWGIIPAAGMATRIQPSRFSKELLPVGSSMDGDVERPRAVSEFLVERMLRAGTSKICFVVAPGKSDIVQYYGCSVQSADLCYVVQPKAGGLCDAIFRACPLIRPMKRWWSACPTRSGFPKMASPRCPDDVLSFLLFPVDRPQVFDAVVTDEAGNVQEIQVKHPDAKSNWIWGAFKMPGHVLHELQALWQERGGATNTSARWSTPTSRKAARAVGVRAGEAYVDVGTVHGYREALSLLANRAARPSRRARARRPSAATTGAPLAVEAASEALGTAAPAASEIERRVHELGDWFQNLDLGGVRTAPAHFLGDFPTIKWKRFAHTLPQDMAGKSVLDIGCNAGFYSFEMKRRGASRVLGIDFDEYYLSQARFAADVLGCETWSSGACRCMTSVRCGERFDLVLFSGCVYHLRHPLLALDLIHEHVAQDMLVYQSLQRGSVEVGAGPGRLRLLGDGDLRPAGLPAAALHREQIFAR